MKNPSSNLDGIFVSFSNLKVEYPFPLPPHMGDQNNLAPTFVEIATSPMLAWEFGHNQKIDLFLLG
jgi:hypothetical protein